MAEPESMDMDVPPFAALADPVVEEAADSVPPVEDARRERRKRGFGDAPIEGKLLFHAFIDLDGVVHRDNTVQEHGNALKLAESRNSQTQGLKFV
jgi:hypothetical protein